MKQPEYDAISKSYLFKNFMYIKTEAKKRYLDGRLSEIDKGIIVVVTDLFAELVEKAPAYVPPLQKPLTLKELKALIDAGREAVFYAETIRHKETYANIVCNGKTFDRYGKGPGADNLRFETYGKQWRAWASRPTDEERAAAPWEE